jgi:hypothetical protein
MPNLTANLTLSNYLRQGFSVLYSLGVLGVEPLGGSLALGPAKASTPEC